MKYNFILPVVFFLSSFLFGQSPTAPALGFNVFVENNIDLVSNETEGPIAVGGDLKIRGYYQVAIHNAGSFLVNGQAIGLLVGGLVNYSNGDIKVNKGYVKIGDITGSKVWYKDNNGANANLKVTKTNGNYWDGGVTIQNNASYFGNVSSTVNPVHQGNLIDFGSAFTQMRASSLSISQCTHNAVLTNANGNPITLDNAPQQVKIHLQEGVNYLNITGDKLNQIAELTFVNQPSSTRILVINVNAPGTFNWKVWNQPGFGGIQKCPFVMYNFYNTTKLHIKSGDTIEGTIFAPFADVDKTGHNSNIEGQMIAKSFTQTAGEMHYANFTPSLAGCATPPVDVPVSDFSVNSTYQCFAGNEFTFTNSTTGTTPMTFTWDFGDGTSSTMMNPVKSYANAGTYTVTLTSTNSGGNHVISKDIVVYPKTNPQISITSTIPGSGSVTKQITLSNPSTLGNYSWEIEGDTSGLFPNQSVVSFDFTEAGLYNLILNCVDINGCNAKIVFPIVIDAGEVSTGGDGGLESEGLGDAVTKRYLKRKKLSQPTKLIKSSATLFNKQALVSLNSSATQYAMAPLTLLNMFPAQLAPGSVGHVTSPTDILDYTVAEEVLSVDFSLSGSTKAVVLGIRTANKVYNHTKASCDRLRGAEILYVKPVTIDGYNFLEQAIKQRNGSVEYAISFAAGLNNTDSHYSLQTNWFVKGYVPATDMFNFQVWSTNPTYTVKLVKDILDNLRGSLPVVQTEQQKIPKTYAAKVSREETELVLKLRSLERQQNVEIDMEANHTETNGYGLNYEPINSELEQVVRIKIDDKYEFDGLIRVDDEIQDAFYHADGNWGLDYDSKYTKILNYKIYNNLDRVYNADEHAIHRTVNLSVNTNDYITLYKSLLPGNLPADYSDYKFVAFTAKGNGILDISLLKSSVTQWKNQYKASLNVRNSEQTYYIPFEYFKSEANKANMTVEDLTTLNFTFLPAKAETNSLDLVVKDVRFTKTAPEGYEDLLNLMKNEYVIYPNPSNGNFTCLLYSDANSFATVTMYDMSGKLLYNSKVFLNEGRNELKFENVNLPSGVVLFNVTSSSVNFGVKKLMIKK